MTAICTHPPDPAGTFLLIVARDIPDFGAEVGDRLIVAPGTDLPICVARTVGATNYGRLAGLIADGALTPSPGADRAVLAELRALLAVLHPPALRLLPDAPSHPARPLAGRVP